MRVSLKLSMAIWLLASVGTGVAQTSPTSAAPNLTAEPTRTYGVSLLGSLSLPPDFKFFPFVNPDAPKGGDVALSSVGTFDNFNPFIVRGNAAADVFRVWDTLMKAQYADEAETAVLPPR